MLAIKNNWLLKAKLNVIADQVGQTLPREMSLLLNVARWVFLQPGTPTVDLFASGYTWKLEVFVSPVPDPMALDTDALYIQWDGLWLYTFPQHQFLVLCYRSSG